MFFAGFFFPTEFRNSRSSLCRELGEGKQNTLLHVQEDRRFSHVCFYNFLLLLEQCIWNESRDLCHASPEPCGPPAVEVDMSLVLPE